MIYMTKTGSNRITVFLQVPLRLDGVPFPLPLAPPTPHTIPHPLPSVDPLVMIISHFSLPLPLTTPTETTRLTNMIR